MDDFMYSEKKSDARSPGGVQIRSPRLRACRTIPDRLRTALSRGLLDNFWALIKAGADIDSRDRLNRTPLHMVIYWKKELAVVKAVLSAGADPNAIDHHGLTPLHAAVHSNSSAGVIKALVIAGAEIDMPDSRGRTPLLSAIHKKDNTAVIRTLLHAGANVKIPNLLVEAIRLKTDHEILRLLLMAGALVNDTSCGLPPILYAIMNEDPIIVKMLIVAGADLHYMHPEHRRSLLHEPAVPEITREFIKLGLDVNAVDHHGETPLHRALVRNRYDVIKTLINAGADVHSVVPQTGNNCLHMAKSAAIVKLLVSYGVDINARNRRGESPLQFLITSCSLLLSPLMRVRGFYVRYFRDTNCMKMNDRIYAVKEMIKQGAKVNAKNNNDITILESAVCHGHSKMVSYLIRNGAQVSWKRLFRKNVINQSAIQLLIRESLIGNVKVKGKNLFENSPSEEPFLRSIKQLLDFTNRCLAEIDLMKSKKVNCNNSIYHYVMEIFPEIKPLRLCSHQEVSDEEYSDLFPIYRGQIAARLNQCFKRAMLLDVLVDMEVAAPRSQAEGTVSLIGDCKLAIAEFLSNNDLYFFLVAMGFNIYKDGIYLMSQRYDECFIDN